MKKVLSFIVALTMICTVFAGISAYAADNAAFRLTSATAKAGETVTLSMMVDNNPGITACAVAIEYPAGLTLTAKATNKNLFSGGSVVVGGNANANPYKVNWSEDFDNFYENGEFFTVTFKVADDAQPGDYEIVVSYDQADVYNADMDDVVFETVNGVITVEADAPADPYELETNYVAAAKNIPVTSSQYGSYNVNTALIFGSSIKTGSADVFGTKITLKDYEGEPLYIEASEAAKYVAGAGKTGFTAAVTSIREANLDKTFVAEAYAVDANGEKVYGEAAEAVFNDVIAAN